jgi:hypothetical protein
VNARRGWAAAGDAAVDGVVGAVAAAVGLSAQADRLVSSLRAPQLDAGVRDQMAFRICAEVAAQISPPPPPGAPPQLVLAASRSPSGTAGADPVEQARAPVRRLDDATGRTARTMATRLHSARRAVAASPQAPAATDTLDAADSGSPPVQTGGFIPPD